MSLNEQKSKVVYWVGLVFLPVTVVVSLAMINWGLLAGCVTAGVSFVVLLLAGEPGFKLWQRVWASGFSGAVR